MFIDDQQIAISIQIYTEPPLIRPLVVDAKTRDAVLYICFLDISGSLSTYNTSPRRLFKRRVDWWRANSFFLFIAYDIFQMKHISFDVADNRHLQISNRTRLTVI